MESVGLWLGYGSFQALSSVLDQQSNFAGMQASWFLLRNEAISQSKSTNNTENVMTSSKFEVVLYEIPTDDLVLVQSAT